MNGASVLTRTAPVANRIRAVIRAIWARDAASANVGWLPGGGLLTGILLEVDDQAP